LSHETYTNVVFVQCCTIITILCLPPRDSGPIALIFQWICNGAIFADNSLIRNKGLYPNLLMWEEDRMILLLFPIAGVVIGVIAVGTSTSIISNSEALVLIGISIIGGAIFLRHKKGKHSSLR